MDLSGRSVTSETIAQLGDLATRVSLVEGMILGAEAAAVPDSFGVMRPKDALLYASQVFQQAMYPALLNQIRGLMGGSLIQFAATADELRAPNRVAELSPMVRCRKRGPRAGEAAEACGTLSARSSGSRLSSRFRGRRLPSRGESSHSMGARSSSAVAGNWIRLPPISPRSD